MDSPDKRRTSLGITFQELKDKKNLEKIKHEEHQKDLRYIFEREDPKKGTIIIIHASIYGYLLHKMYVPAEISVTAFNVNDGILDNYCTLIDPYEIPKGMGFEARERAKKLSVPYPPFDNRCQNYKEITAILEKFVERYKHPKLSKGKLFCLNEDKAEIMGCLDWLYRQCEKENPHDLFSLGEAVYKLSNVGLLNRSRNESVPLPVVIQQLVQERKERDILNYTSEDSGSITSGYMYTSGMSSTSSRTQNSEESSESGWNDIDWGKFRAGIFLHEKHVEQFLSSYNLAFDGELGCPYHYAIDESLQTCAANVTNRFAYNILDVLITTFGVKRPKLTFHIPALKDEVQQKMEVDRRKLLYKNWGMNIFSPEDLYYKPEFLPKPDQASEPNRPI